jgi:hypothetical protein
MRGTCLPLRKPEVKDQKAARRDAIEISAWPLLSAVPLGLDMRCRME